MTTDEHTGPVRMPAGLAVEAPQALRPGRARRVIAGVVAGVTIAALAVALAVHGTTDSTPDPATSKVATPAVEVPEATERALAGAVGPARQVMISPAGDRVLAVRDRGVDIWQLDGAHTAWLAVDGDRVAGAAWSKDGTRVVVWGPEGTVRLWNADSGALVRTIQAGMGFVASAEITDDGHVVTIGADGVRRVWDLASGEVRVHRGASAAPPPAPLQVDAITPDRTWRAFVDARGGVKLERLDGCDAVQALFAPAPHAEPVASTAVAIDPS